MSLRSGRNYLKDYAAEELDEAAGGEQQPDIATQPATMQQQSQPFDTKSQQSRTLTRRSQRTSSSTASAAARVYAKAQAARDQLAFAEKEANAMKQRAELDAHLHVLQCQKAIAEASAYEEAEIQSGELYGELCEDAEPISTVHRTNEYVQQQCELLYPDTQHDPAQLPKVNDNEVDVQDSTQITNPFITNSQMKPPPVNRERKQEQTVNTCVVDTYWSNSPKHTPNFNNCLPEASETQHFAKYLIRKELISTGLLQFDDKPENYWAWKTSFISATKDLNLSPREELDLLTKWLGPTSSEQAKRIHAVHTLNPAAGAKMVWQRLEECYGSPEAIEDALLKKVEDFPQLTSKDNVKLQELSDILLELQCAKQDGALPGLAYLDTARGVRQIVDKLPFNLQEKWTTVGTQYKETHSVSFPPFSVFTQFVQRQAKMRNDPSFAMSKANTHVPSPTEKLRSYSRSLRCQHTKWTLRQSRTRIFSVQRKWRNRIASAQSTKNHIHSKSVSFLETNPLKKDKPISKSITSATDAVGLSNTLQKTVKQWLSVSSVTALNTYLQCILVLLLPVRVLHQETTTMKSKLRAHLQSSRSA
ncbi:uncharacterized protein LOC116328883 [Oreochromis aureus]|uniref:uncharacterized protein LOC116328883 n=1 Tax=Oreochromis aureus TaxID=47969 RepID=UPI00195488EF|nr:uncharacterized protein LOC116328883 [Oreochromis aureus]XP_039462344.1 uncharacterized protein LOC116328883 [Oreochromis aureus]XP_039462345.1 uncharacterized protein LOC116328883 [Oreochromis aureus]